MATKKTTGGGKKEKAATPKKSQNAGRSRALQAVAAPKKTDPAKTHEAMDFPIVGIGASAGGLEAFEQFFNNMPPDNGMAFVLVQHLDPTHKSILTDLIRSFTRMSVTEVKDGMKVEPDTIYVIPPNSDMAILHGQLHLMEPSAPRGLRQPIDFFFRSLSEDRKERAICIVLSGSGTEGTLGLREIKGQGGMVMVQDPSTAKYDSMPRSAIGTGLVDYVLPPDKMPEQLIAYVQHPFTKQPGKAPETESDAPSSLQKILTMIRSRTGHDFSYYKQSTIVRRVERRMAIHEIGNLSDYLRYLQQYPDEIHILFKELLIGVTNFFRDAEAFEHLKKKVIPAICKDKGEENGGVRVWVPGCSTGEEAYSLAMLFREHIDQTQSDIKVQIFATDIDNSAIETARAGLYPHGIAVDVQQDRLRNFFSKQDGAYRVKKDVRDMVIFAAQNLITDPPFSKIDLISCRNLLIYMGSELQKRILPIFHYSLAKGGFLFLGTAETIGEFSDLFAAVDRRWKIFRRKDTEPMGAIPMEVTSACCDRRQRSDAGGTEGPEALSAPLSRPTVANDDLAHRLQLASNRWCRRRGHDPDRGDRGEARRLQSTGRAVRAASTNHRRNTIPGRLRFAESGQKRAPVTRDSTRHVSRSSDCRIVHRPTSVSHRWRKLRPTSGFPQSPGPRFAVPRQLLPGSQPDECRNRLAPMGHEQGSDAECCRLVFGQSGHKAE